MNTLAFSDPAWRTTFPHRVAPLPDEWLPGLLLRCDEDNHWKSGTTFRYLLRLSPHEAFGPRSSLIVMPALMLQCLAQMLLIAQEQLLATTYQMELERLYPHHYGIEGKRLTGGHRSTSATFFATSVSEQDFAFHLCPACLAQTRLLKRTLVLPYMHYCPLHHLSLRSYCDCGYPLGLFSAKTLPFT